MEKILKRLISFQTLSKNHSENEKILEWIKKQIKGLPLYSKEFKSNNFPSLILTTQKTKKPFLWLQAHLDVVSGSRKMFRPKIINNRLYGRGAFDMKFAVACYLKILKEIGPNLSKYNFGVMLTTDEEMGGFNGVKFILKKGYISKICFLPDGGGDWKFEKAAKGVWHLAVESYGKSAHGSKPWLGENAIDQLINFLNELAKKFPQEPCRIADHYHETLNIGKIEGGKATNQVPSYASASIDIRFRPGKKSKIKEFLESTKRKYKNIKIKEIIFGNSYQVDINNYYFKLFSKIAYKKFKIKKSFIVSNGSSDARFFIEKKVPVILIRPKGGGHHSEKEWIDLKDLDRYCVVLREFIEYIAKNK